MTKFDEVKSKVEFVQKYLKGKSPETLFGSNRHKFELSPCLSDNEISEFETKHNIVLPAQYRRFISEIGNGGMGPGLGVIALGFQNYRENPDPLYYPEYLSVPFQYTETWNYDFETFDFENEADEEYEYRLAGSIPIALYGCTHECQLVITGEEAGNIWWDERGTDYGILPHTDSNGNHIDFITWYDSWLDEIIIKARKSNLIPEDSSSPKPRTNHYLLKIIEITDKNTWNSELAKLPYAHVLQTWEWGQFKYETTGWIPHRWAFKRDDKIVAMCSMGERKVGLFSLMYAPKGPAMDYSDLNLVDEVLGLLQEKAKKHRAIWLKIDPDLPYATGVPGEADDMTVEPGNAIKNMLGKNSWTFSDDQIQFRNTVTIDLTRSEDDILMAMSGNTRRKVRQAEKKGVTIREASIDDMDTLYALYDITGDRNAFLIRPKDYYLKLWHYFMENDRKSVV